MVPVNIILSGDIPAFKQALISPEEVQSKLAPSDFKILKIAIFELAFTAK